MGAAKTKEKMNPDRAIRLMLIGAAAATLPCAWLGMRFGTVVDMYADPIEGLMSAPLDMWGDIAAYPLWVGTGTAACVSALVACAIPWAIVMALLLMRRDNMRVGEEQGSARWASTAEIVPYAAKDNPDPVYNKILLSKNAGIALSRTAYNQALDRNANVLVLGGSGTGKTRYFVKPNLLQLNGDSLITDPKGDLEGEMRPFLEAAGYNVRSLNTFLTDRSGIYNPLSYVRTDLEVISFAKMFISMTTGTQKSGGDPFWEKAETALYMALIAYMRDYLPERDYHIGTLLKLMSLAKASEANENAKSPLDCLFEEIKTGMRPRRRAKAKGGRAKPSAYGREETAIAARQAAAEFETVPSPLRRRSDGRKPGELRLDGKRGFSPHDDFALLNYTNFKAAAGKTLKSIIISCNVRLAPFTASDVRALVSGADDMHLDELGSPDSRNVIFGIFRDTDQRTLGFLHGMMVYQAINCLCEKALRDFNGKLPRPVSFVLDEYRSLNLPADISAMISVVRSRNISMSIILQGISQLAELYDEKTAESIRACCDTTLFLGAAQNDSETRKFISQAIGQQTIVVENITSQHSGQGGWSRAQNKVARALMTEDEVARLSREKCIVLISGENAYMDDKYPLTEHPRYKQLNDAVGRS